MDTPDVNVLGIRQSWHRLFDRGHRVASCFRDRLMVRNTTRRSGEGVQACLCDTDRQRRDRDPSAGQRVQELPVTSTSHPQQVRRRDLAVLEAQRVRVGGMPPQLAI